MVDAQEDGMVEADVAVVVDVGMTNKVIHIIKIPGIAMAVDVMEDVEAGVMADTMDVDAHTQTTFHATNGFVCRINSVLITWLGGEMTPPRLAATAYTNGGQNQQNGNGEQTQLVTYQGNQSGNADGAVQNNNPLAQFGQRAHGGRGGCG